MPKRISLLVLFLALAAMLGYSQDKPNVSPVPAPAAAKSSGHGLAPELFSMSVAPGMSIPMFADSAYFDLGGSADIEAEMRMPFFPLAYVGLNAFNERKSVRKAGLQLLSAVKCEL